MPKIPAYKRIANELVRKCKASRRVDITKTVNALLKDKDVQKALQGMCMWSCINWLFLDSNHDYVGAIRIVHNLQVALQAIAYSERYSGIKQSVLTACVGGKHQSSIARLLKVC